MERVLSEDRDATRIVDAARRALEPIEEALLRPFGDVEPILRQNGVGRLDTTQRTIGGNVELPKVTTKDSGRLLLIHNQGSGSITVKLQPGGQINNATSNITLTSGSKGFFIVVPDGDDCWMYV